MADFRYKAFVSYSWADAEWGKWLLHEIETYRTPAALVGKPGLHGEVAARLSPLFKDREEEAAGASIGAAVEAALAASEFLIVICSPRSAQSQWVNREVAWFKTHRDPDKILALIVDGEPGGGELECFPKALTHQVLPDLTVTDTPVDAPLAADARITGDGKRKAKLKIAAAMLGIGLGELVNRDEARRTLRTRIVVASSLALAAVMSGMAWFAVQQRNEAEHQRAESDGLVEFMLTDLRQRLEPVGRLDALDVVGQRALKYYAGQKASSLDADALGRRARALHLVGEVSNIRGDSVAGLTAFRQAAATTAEQLARDPNNPQRIFDHAQSVFWVGYVAYERREYPEAEAQWREYKRLADQLVSIDPNKPEWQMEVSYAQSNLGTLLFDQARFVEAEPAFNDALTIVEKIAKRMPSDASTQLLVGSAINWLARNEGELHHIPKAYALHQREIGLYEGLLRSDAANSDAKRGLAVARMMIGQLELFSGKIDAAITATNASLDLLGQLRAIEPGNTEWQEAHVRALIQRADILSYTDRRAERVVALDAADVLLGKMVSADPKNQIWGVGLRSLIDLEQEMLCLDDGQPLQALTIAAKIHQRLVAATGFDPNQKAKIELQAQMYAGDALQRMGRAAEASAVWQAQLTSLPPMESNRAALGMRVRYALLRRLGRDGDAKAVLQILARQGENVPAWLFQRKVRSR